MTVPHPSRPLDLTWTVNEVLREYPATIRAFNAFGVDACCGGAATLRAAAQGSGLLPEALVFALQSVIREDAEDAVLAASRLAARADVRAAVGR